jgi:N-acetylmuramoyl-L-alanine amidase
MKTAGMLFVGTLLAATAAFSVQERTSPGVGPTVMQDTVQTALPTELIGIPAEPEPWVRPDGPVRVALQAGHWKAREAPDEQAGLRTNGTRGGGKAEWEVNYEIATIAAEMLRDEGFEVEILPTTIPPGYWADLFVSIHADGNPNTSISGYRAAAPRRDVTGRASEFVRILEESYGRATGLRHYPNVTRRMTGYYAFNFRRYEHALDPMTVGVILETGFLTSPNDRRIIVQGQDRAARGIADAVTEFLSPLKMEIERKAALAMLAVNGAGPSE